jgi:hypothetical protein
LLHEKARSGLIAYYSKRVDDLVDASHDQWSYPQAQGLVLEMEGLFPDSQAAVREVRERLAARKSAALLRLAAEFDTDLARGALVPALGQNNIETVLSRLRQVDPRSPLLHDPRLQAAFTEAAEAALRAGNVSLAAAVTSAGVKIMPANLPLLELHQQAKRALGEPRQVAAADLAAERIEQKALSARTAPPRAGLPPSAMPLEQARSLAQLVAKLSPDDPRALAMKRRLEDRLARGAQAIRSSQGPDAAVEYAKGASQLFPESTDLSQLLAKLQAVRGGGDESKQGPGKEPLPHAE